MNLNGNLSVCLFFFFLKVVSVLQFLHCNRTPVSQTVWAAIWSLFPSIFFCGSLKFFVFFFFFFLSLFQLLLPHQRIIQADSYRITVAFKWIKLEYTGWINQQLRVSGRLFIRKCHKWSNMLRSCTETVFLTKELQLCFTSSLTCARRSLW